MNPITTITSRFIALPVQDIDTDQIIPARYLKAVDKTGLGEALFSDWRYNPDGSPRQDFVLNQPGAQGAQILLAGNNFGCGSSREHAVWALTGFGFQAVISTSFADIFCNNALKNGLLPVIVSHAEHAELVNLAKVTPAAELIIDLESQTVALPNGKKFTFPIDPFSKACLLRGIDELGYLLGFIEQISEFERGGRST